MKYTIREKLAALREKLSARKAGTRLLALLLTLVLFQGDLMLSAYSAGGEGESGETSAQTSTPETTVPTTPEQTEAESKLPVDEDTLVITLDGAETTAVSLLPYEKAELKAEGLESDAEYQWQIRHPETGAWINIYDATEQCISVSAALVKNMLTKDGTAALRCYAHAENADYVTSFVTVTMAEESVAPVTPASSSAFTTSGGAVTLADEPPEFVTVTIEYVRYDFLKDTKGNLIYTDVDGDGMYSEGDTLTYNEGVQAFSSYMATLVYNHPLNTEVEFPTLVGYDSYLNEVKTNTITIDLPAVTANTVYTVEYRPKMVDFKIRYFFQNIYDDLYVEDYSKQYDGLVSEGKGAYTGAVPYTELLEKEFDGFTALYHQPDTIAADGSTIFEVYYERNYYLMEFDCNGGYGTSTLYNRYGSFVSVPSPVRPGYVFGKNGDGNGWDLVKTEQAPTPTLGDGVGDTLPATMPPYNSAYKAIWDRAATSYTVVYWRENADDNNYSYWGSVPVGLGATNQPDGSVISASYVNGSDNVPTSVSNATVDGEIVDEKVYFTYNDVLTDKNILVMGDGSTVVNVYYDRNEYTLNFRINNNTFNVPNGSHVHQEGVCYGVLDCGLAHIHDESCGKTLICTIPEHKTHTNECLTCSLPVHAHSTTCSVCDKEGHVHDAGCCNLEEHVHSTDCYSLSNGTWGAAYDGTPTGTTADNGIMRVESGWNNYYYYKIGDAWYQITGLSNWWNDSNYYANVTVEVCTKNVHSHGDGNCDYSSCALHVHTAECYKCGKLTHTHSTNCCTVEEHTVHTTACYTFTGATLGNAVTDDRILTSIQNNVGGNNQANNGIVRVQSYGSYRYYYLIGSTWYQIQLNNTNWENVTVETCEKNIHTHGDGNCVYCTEEEHTHSNACMDCGLVAHTHTDSCYKDVIHTHTETCYSYSCGKDNHVHTDTCYTTCTKPENQVVTINGTRYYQIIAKYDQTIGDIWPTAASFPDIDLYGWTISGVSSTAVTKRVTMTSDLCNTAANGNNTKTATIANGSGSERNVYYMFESFYQTDTIPADGTNRILRNGVYYDKSDLYSQVVYSGSLSHKAITGMKENGTTSSGNNQFLFYTRNRSALNFHNYNAVLSDKTQTLMFQQPLAAYEISKEEMERDYYPSTLEPGAYEFGGWFTSDGCYDGTEVNWDTITMSNGSLTLFAKWTPIMRNVIFYSAYSDIAADTNDTTDKVYHFMKADSVAHGTTLGSTYLQTPEHPDDLDPTVNGGVQAETYDFVGWFYMDESNKKRFAPDSMKVTRNLVLFAEWQTNVDTTYEVKYVLQNAITDPNYTTDHTTHEAGAAVSDLLFAHASVGQTKTFEAPAGTALLPPFRKKFFPTVNSHSILMENDSNLNKYTFEYVYDDRVYYKIRYLEEGTGKELATSKVMFSDEAIITEKFKPIDGYIPTSFYLTKTLQYDGAATEETVIPANIFTFYYVLDSEHGLYTVEYYTENADSKDNTDLNNYTRTEYTVGTGDLNDPIQADQRTYVGFECVPSMHTVISYKANGDVDQTLVGSDKTGDPPKGTVTNAGLVIRLYYKRIPYAYKIICREYETEKILTTTIMPVTGADTKDPSYRFESEVSETAADTLVYNGQTYYLHVTAEKPKTQSLEIRTETNNADPTANVITFYYALRNYTVNYKAICSVPGVPDFGIVSPNYQQGTAINKISGAVAVPGAGFRFVEWQRVTNEDVIVDGVHTQREEITDAGWVNDTKLTPKDFEDDLNDDGVITYYALFEPVTTSLHLTKTVSDTSRNDTFLFLIEGHGKHTYLKMTVAVPANSTVTITEIPIDEYKITELTAWSWEYSKPTSITANAVKDGSTTVDLPNAAITFTIVEQDTHQTKNNIQFTNQYVKPKWLGGESAVADNNFD